MIFDKMNNLLDAWDKKILSAIEFDYTISHSQIAKKIRRSKPFVAFRIKRMEQLKMLQYQPLIDYSRLGYTYYRVIIETLLEKEEILKHIKDTIKTVWLVEKYDRENFVFVIRADSFGHFQKMWEMLYEELAPYILTKDISIAYRVYHLPMTFLTGNLRDQYFTSGAQEKTEVSEKEQRILEALTGNPKISNKDLCKKIKISANTLKQYIKKLRNQRVLLAFQTLIDKKILDIKHYKLFLSFEFSQANKEKVIRVLKKHPNVVYITETSYHYDLECEIYCYDDFEDIIKEIKESYPFKRVIISQMKSEQKSS